MSRRPSSAGFTLVEVIIATGIFVILAGAIFAAVSASTRAAAVVGEEVASARKLDAFKQFLRVGFASASATTRFEVRTRERGQIVELVLRNAPDAFRTGLQDAAGSCVVLAARPDGNGLATLCLTRFSEKLTPDQEQRSLEKAAWTPVLGGIEKLRWRFLGPGAENYVEDWDPGRGRPRAISLEFKTSGTDRESLVFLVPNLTPQAQAVSNAEPLPKQP